MSDNFLKTREAGEWRARTPHLLSRLARGLLLDGLVLLGLLLGLEATLRTTGLGRPYQFNDERTAGNPWYVNDAGIREKDPIRAKAPGETRILAVGDSTTLGSGVAWDATYAK